MIFLECNRKNLASVLLGKNVYIPWRGQNNVIISIPMEEWLSFVKDNQILLQKRKPLDYSNLTKECPDSFIYKYFMFDCAWALYNEVMCSANLGLNSTIILPKLNTPNIKKSDDVLSIANRLPRDVYDKHYRLLNRAFPCSANLDKSNLNDWNKSMLNLSVYLSSLGFNDKEKFNIIWS